MEQFDSPDFKDSCKRRFNIVRLIYLQPIKLLQNSFFNVKRIVGWGLVMSLFVLDGFEFKFNFFCHNYYHLVKNTILNLCHSGSFMNSKYHLSNVVRTIRQDHNWQKRIKFNTQVQQSRIRINSICLRNSTLGQPAITGLTVEKWMVDRIW